MDAVTRAKLMEGVTESYWERNDDNKNLVNSGYYYKCVICLYNAKYMFKTCPGCHRTMLNGNYVGGGIVNGNYCK